MKKSIILASIGSVFASTAAFASIDTSDNSVQVRTQYDNPAICAITSISEGEVGFLDYEPVMSEIAVTTNTSNVTFSLDQSENQGNLKPSHEVVWHLNDGMGEKEMVEGDKTVFGFNTDSGSATRNVQLFPEVQLDRSAVKAGIVNVNGTFTISCN